MPFGIMRQAAAGARLEVYVNQEALDAGANPLHLGTQRCCALLKTQGLLNALKEGRHDAAIGGARREEEKSRAKERIYSFRDRFGQWDPKNQRPELWNLYNGRVSPGESIRIFPLSNWTELDIWQYILRRKSRQPALLRPGTRGGRAGRPDDHADGRGHPVHPGETPKRVMCRFRTLGCYPCTGAVRSTATTVEEIVEEVRVARTPSGSPA
jgi:sulfate adenylyltransferase subunit 2